MDTSTLDRWTHRHDFSELSRRGEKRASIVLLLTVLTMVVEITAGIAYGSMALLADGWHMGTHVAAFLITIFAYRYARAHANDSSFSFGTGKVSVLGGFASAIALTVVALTMLVESLQRLLAPQAIRFDEALIVAAIGLAVNLASVVLLHEGSHDDHDHGGSHHHDHNLKAAYLHVLADALTSVLAIVALVAGKCFGWRWTDPAMGAVGAIVISRWAWRLLREVSPILLDRIPDEPLMRSIRERLEADGETRIVDLHLWRVGPRADAVLVSVVSKRPRPAESYKRKLLGFEGLAHISIEVNCASEEP